MRTPHSTHATRANGVFDYRGTEFVAGAYRHELPSVSQPNNIAYTAVMELTREQMKQCVQLWQRNGEFLERLREDDISSANTQQSILMFEQAFGRLTRFTGASHF